VIDLYASQPHYAEHLWPVWEALPDEVRGRAMAPRAGCWWGTPDYVRPGPRDGLVMVAGFADARRMAPRPLVYVEHGAGQTYPGDPRAARHGSYAGGEGLDRVRLFIAPSETVADRWRAEYRAPVAIVGCPKLDRWHAENLRGSRSSSAPVVAVTFHWDCQLIPETRSAFRHFAPGLARLRDDVRAAGGELWGHGHPRAWGALSRTWRTLGVPLVPSFADILDGADVLVVDNTSAGPEFASTGRPVLWLNAPWYRRDIDHGGRFWQWPRGQVVCDHPDDLPHAVAAAVADPPQARASRARMVAGIYASTDGHAADRAAAAIMEVF
jgi:hypothetical protein